MRKNTKPKKTKNNKKDKKSKSKEKIKSDIDIEQIDKNEMKESVTAQKKTYDQSEIEVVRKHVESIIDSRDSFENIKDSEVQEGDLAYKKTGFGWNGLGSRRIVFDDTLKEYRYEVIEPKLTKEEEDIKDKLTYFFRVRADIDVFDQDEKEQKKNLEKALDRIVAEKHLKLKDDARDRVYYYIFQEYMGYGKIDILMHDEGIEDISCDGIKVPIFIFHKDFESIRTNIVFGDTDELDSFIVKLSQMCGKQISVYEPIVDGKLDDGSRLQTTLSKTITRYSTFTIRRFRESPLTPIDLIENNTLSLEMAAYFWMAIEKGTSMLFCGGTAAGKTTALNALSLFLPATFKIVSIEDTREINLPHENWIAGTTRTGFTSSEVTKTGRDIDMFDLIKVALRQRPRVIIVGEVRGKEAYTMFQAMTTGHLSYSTIHASDLHTLIQRLENKPIDLPRALLTSLDLIVFLNSVTIDGAPVRRITNVTEVIKLDPGSNRLVTLTPYHWVSEIDDRFESAGGSRIMHKIKMQHGWNASRLNQELENRKSVLNWMLKKNLRSYEDVGRIVSEYTKNPTAVLDRVKEDK
jgi:flagellar protein FlaI